MKNNENFQLWDYLKVLAALSVLVIHIGPFTPLSETLNNGLTMWARFAVPFFLITAGFFVEKGMQKRNESVAYVTQYMKRLFFYYVAWWIVYIPLTSYGWHGPFIFEKYHGQMLLLKAFTKYFLGFFTGSTFVGSWYISATIIGVFVVFRLFRNLSYRQLIVTGIITVTFVLMVDNLGGLFISNNVWKWYHAGAYLKFASPLTQTFLVAIPLLIIGKFMFLNLTKLQNLKIRTVSVLIGISAVLTIIENYGLNHLGGRNIPDESIFSIMLATSLILLALNKEIKNIISEPRWLRQYSSFLYPAQFGLIVLYKTALDATVGHEINAMLLYGIVLLTETILFFILRWASNKVGWIKYFW